jgi:hypothetical protein
LPERLPVLLPLVVGQIASRICGQSCRNIFQYPVLKFFFLIHYGSPANMG